MKLSQVIAVLGPSLHAEPHSDAKQTLGRSVGLVSPLAFYTRTHG